MLKNMTIKKISIATILLFLTVLFVLFPKNEDSIKLKNEIIEYTNDLKKQEIYLVSKDNYVARTNVVINEDETEKKVRELLEYLIIDGKNESKIPNGFRSIIPSGTEIKDISLKDQLLKINFSKEILEIDENLEEKMLESIVYSLTSIDGIKGILIYVEDELLTVLPKTKKILPSILDRNLGINKEYNISDTKDITKTTVYYVSKNNNEYYYVPVTKINNTKKDKVKVIIDELSSGPIYEDNLMSFMNINTELEKYKMDNDNIYLTFNDYILNSIEDKSILDEVIYTISLSIKDNYDIKNVIFMIGEEEITKSVLKTLE